jgi:DNA-binding CsgD family transcriptional regulator
VVVLASDVIGRDEELDVITRFLGERPARGTLLIDGEAGIGKTTLWRAAVAAAESSGWHVLVARPVEAEAALSFASLADLVGSVPEEAREGLPEPQRRALQGALLLDEPAGGDARTLPTALVSLLAGVAERGPVLVAIDDVQWLDPASEHALAFAVRRLPVNAAVVAARRSQPGERPPLGLDSLPHARLAVGPLSLAGLRQVIVGQLGSAPARPVLMRIAEASGGNPFVAVELARALAAEPVVDRRVLPVPPTLQEALAARLGRLSESARETALAVAVLSRPTVSLVAAAVEGGEAGLLAAEEAGVLVEEGVRVRFSHPLLASAVIAGSTPAALRLLHRRLAGIVEDREERARHLAAGETSADAAIASEIVAGALQAARRGAQEAAAELYGEALRLTPVERREEAAQRRVGQANALRALGDPAGARAAAEQALELAETGATRAAALIAIGDAAWVTGADPPTVYLERALEQAEDRRLRARIHAKIAGFMASGHADAYEHAVAAADLIDENEDPGLLAYVLIAQLVFGTNSGRCAPDPALLQRALALEQRAGSEAELNNLGMIWYHGTDDVEGARERYAFEERWHRERGDEGWRANRAAHLAIAELRAGNVERAEELAEESCAVLETIGGHGFWTVGLRARSLVDLHRGRVERARETVGALAKSAENTWLAALDLDTLGLAELVAGDLEAAAATFRKLEDAIEQEQVVLPVGVRPDPSHIEALVALDQVEQARAALERFEQRAQAFPRLWTAVTLPRARALVLAAEGNLDAALDALDALDETEAARLPHDLGRALLVRGRLLRRAKRRSAAAEALGRAFEQFERLGAVQWAAQAREEIDRLGLRRGDPDELTATERRIAELAASGLTNREVAQAAFVSPKTVEANLARVYRKLGIRSRAELGARIGATGGDAGEAT